MSSRPSRGAARLAAILDALPDALVLVNANGTVVNANTIALEAFEAPGTALVGRGLLDLLPHFDSRLIPGSMRRPDATDTNGRTKPTRMTARRTDGSEFPVEVTSANLEDGRQAYDGQSYTGDELLMLVVRDLSGTIDTEAELARSQRQTEMILRAAAEGVVGTDTDGRIVLVNPAAAQILGYRASDLGGKELHTLVLHSREDGSPFPYGESPLHDTLRSGRKHRVRGQVLWSKSGDQVPVDLTTSPVRDGDQIVGAVMTFTDRRPFDTLVAEKDEADQQHQRELERLAAEHKEELERLRAEHTAELDALREQHTEEIAAGDERYAALGEREKDRFDALAARHEQLLAVLGRSLRGPLDELRGQLSALAADDAGQLWPEANQVLHHLAAGYSRITTLIDNVLGYQRLDTGEDQVVRTPVMLDSVIAAGVDGAVELIGPGRVQFAVHAPPIEAEVDAQRLAQALAHLIADVAGVDSTGNAPVSAGGYMDNTVVVAAAQRGEVVRIEVRGPYAGGDPVHQPIVCGVVRAHGGVLQTHQVPGMSGNAYVLEVPLGGAAGALAPAPVAIVEKPGIEAGTPEQAVVQQAVPEAIPEAALQPVPEAAQQGGGRRRARRSSVDAFLESEVGGAASSSDTAATAPTGRRRRRAAEEPAAEASGPVQATAHEAGAETSVPEGPGRRHGRPNPVEGGAEGATEGAMVMTAAGPDTGAVALPPQGVPAPTGRRARRDTEQAELPPALPTATDAPPEPTGRRRRALAAANERAAAEEPGARPVFALPPAEADRTPEQSPLPAAQADTGRHDTAPHDQAEGHTPPQPHPVPVSTGRRARRAVTPVRQLPDETGEVDMSGATPPQGVPAQTTPAHGVPAQLAAPQVPAPDAPQPVPAQGVPAPAVAPPAVAPHAVASQSVPPQGIPAQGIPAQGIPAQGIPAQGGPGGVAVPQPSAQSSVGQPVPAPSAASQPVPAALEQALPVGAVQAQPGPQHAQPLPAATTPPSGTPVPPQAAQPQPWPGSEAPGSGSGSGSGDTSGAGRPVPQPTPSAGTPLPPERTAPPRIAQPLPAETAMPVDPHATQGQGISVRTLGQGVPFARQVAASPQAQPRPRSSPSAPHQPNGSGRRRKLGTPPEPTGERPETAARPHPQAASAPLPPQPSLAGQSRPLAPSEGAGRSYAIGAPDANADEGPEPLDGPGGAVEVADHPQNRPMDDELPPEPLDNPRRLLVWPAPDVTTQQALSDRGYRPVVVNSREEVDAQIAAFPAALFIDPLTGPITRTALQSLRQAAVAAEVPVLVTAGLGQATREAAYGADPAVLLKALAPRDSEQHPPRVLLVEEHTEIALALTASLERRGMQVARAASDADAVALAAQMRPNLVVMDLMRVHRRQAGVVDWLRANNLLKRTPLVVYTAAVDQADLPRLVSGETVLFLAERSTSTEVQERIVDLLARIGTN
ncbi:PAS domain-containing protein [Streptomyces sp. RY43-2]|uniref:histidine kinase n=1 Tax=Streptomyces macrolidinus TaxID=2952607 RepID=A0ABT0ZHT2_9ACTN|nr:PAS domain-containing protein [Streptomyces macrolidinus]MCN9243154.1 PAS domain-containing protein [Streptomyces macrolidinus]